MKYHFFISNYFCEYFFSVWSTVFWMIVILVNTGFIGEIGWELLQMKDVQLTKVTKIPNFSTGQKNIVRLKILSPKNDRCNKFPNFSKN